MNKPNHYQFYGGQAHNKIMYVPEGYPDWKVPIPLELEGVMYDPEDTSTMAEITTHYDHYFYETLITETGNKLRCYMTKDYSKRAKRYLDACNELRLNLLPEGFNVNNER